ncbi:hypothetical protein Tco_1220823 [Tanacetum coccineum]
MTKALSASSSTRNPPRKIACKIVINISSNESSPIRDPLKNYIITTPTTPLETPLQTPLTPPVTTPLVIPRLAPQPTVAITLAPRELIFATPPTSPHLYLNTPEDLPPRSTNPPTHPIFEFIEILASQPPLLLDHIDVESSLPTSNLRNSRLSALLEPYLTRSQISEELKVFTIVAVIVRDFYKKFYNSLGSVPNRCSVV